MLQKSDPGVYDDRLWMLVAVAEGERIAAKISEFIVQRSLGSSNVPRPEDFYLLFASISTSFLQDSSVPLIILGDSKT